MGFIDGRAVAVVAAGEVIDHGPVVGFWPRGPFQGEGVAGRDRHVSFAGGGADVADDVRVCVFGGFDGAEVGVLRGGPAGEVEGGLLPGLGGVVAGVSGDGDGCS